LEDSEINLKLARLAFESDQWPMAASYYKSIVEIPQYRAEALIHQTQCATKLDALEDALDLATQSIKIMPESIVAWQQFSGCAGRLGKVDEEIDARQKLIELEPGNEDHPLNLARLFQGQARHQEATRYFDRAIELAPSSFEVRWARCVGALWKIYKSEDEITRQREFYARELAEIAAMVDQADPATKKNWQSSFAAVTPYFLSCQMANDVALQQIYGKIASAINEAATPKELLGLPRRQSGGTKKRVGFISGAFKSHTVTKLFRGWWKNLDKSIFEIVILDAAPGTDALAKEAKEFADDYRALPFDWIGQVETVRSAACDILIYLEVGQEPSVNALASIRLAPIQAATWGHILTTGYRSIDYFISGEFIEPVDDADEVLLNYSEKLVKLPHISISYEPPIAPPTSASRQQFGLSEKRLLLLCSQTHYKYLPRFDDVLIQIACALPESQFVFLDRHLAAMTDSLRSRLMEKFNAAGLDPKAHIIFLPQLSYGEYLELNTVCDLFLDTLLWTGAMTTLEAIDCGLPVVTMAAGDIRGLQSAGMLRLMGLDQYIAVDVEDYVSKVTELGSDKSARQVYQNLLIDHRNRLYNDKDCIRGLQEFLLNNFAGR
jgi:protein O-GlcNAc transferase